VVAQRGSRLVRATDYLLTQQLEVLVRESPGLPAAMRSWAEVAAIAVLAKHLLDEGLPDAERGGDLFNGRVAALDGGDNFLPEV
jgi:hypothetical protein